MNCVTKPKLKSYIHCPGTIPLLGLTVGELFDKTATKYGTLEGLVVCDGNIRRTFSELKTEVDNLAAGLLSTGLKHGDRVACWGTNSHFYYLTQMATWTAGLILVNINPGCQQHELLYNLKHAGVKCLVIAEPYCSYNYYEMALEVMPEIAECEPGQTKATGVLDLATVITMEPIALPGTFTMNEVMKRGTMKEFKEMLTETMSLIQMDDICSIMYTSGTTGDPKGAMMSHHNIVNNGLLIGKRYGITEKDKLCLNVQMSHVFGSVIGTLVALNWGATCVFPSKTFEGKTSLLAVSAEKCTIIYGTPTMYMGILDEPDLQDHDLSSLRLAISAGATCARQLIERLKTELGIATVGKMCGMTETGVVFESLPSDSFEIRCTTDGCPLEHVEAKVIDQTGRIVPRGEAGELCIRGYSVTRGYYNNPEKTAESIDSSNWFHTGDILVMQESGYGLIVGRIKDMIRVGAESVFPKDIEDILHSHPNILESHVFGVPDLRLGEEVAVWVRLRGNIHMSENEVKMFCVGKMDFYKIPSYVMFVKEFPKTTSGKVQKHKMKDHALTRRHLYKTRHTAKPRVSGPSDMP